jgi:citryl-CoA lyase
MKMAKTVHHKDLKSFFGDEDHLELSQNVSFADLIFETLSGHKPSPSQSKVFELILNLSIDHGPDTPSAVPLIEKAKSGATISEAVAEGVLQINDRHGGAIEPGMRFFYQIKNENMTDEQITELVKDHLDNKKIIGGFGHRIYKEEDPRAQLIIKTLQQSLIGAEFIDIATKVEAEIARQKGVKLPLNIDGAIAIALCDFNWDPKLGKAVFLSARVPGLCAHFINNSEK